MHAVLILDTNYTVQGVIHIENGVLQPEFFDLDIQKKISPILDTFSTKTLYVQRGVSREDGGNYIVAQPVASTDSKYPEAVAEELESHRFTTALVDVELTPYVPIANHMNLSAEERRAFVVALINAGPEQKKEFIDTLSQIKPTLDKIEENREEWKRFLQKKTDEISNNKAV